MKAFSLRVAVVVAGLALAAPVLAQSPKAGGDPGGGGRGGGGGGATTGGGPAGGGNIASSVSGGGGGGEVSGSSLSSPSVGSIGPSSSFGGHGGMQMAAPVHRTSLNYSDNGGGQRTHTAPSSSPSSGERAVPRTNAQSSGSSPSASSGSRSPRNGDSPRNDQNTTSRTARTNVAESARTPNTALSSNNASGAREVPSWSRSRGDRPVTGTAVPRSPNNPAPDRNHGRYGGYYDPYYYDPYGVYGFYGFGGGYYGFYDPFYYPYGFGGYGLDPGFGFPYYADPSSPYDYGEGYGSYSSRIYSGRGQGALKLKVKPRDAKVYVDGYFVGNVDQFDGAFQKLALNSGSHKVEIKADGYETAEFDVLITQDKTLTFAGDLKKLQ